ncbi:MAG: hypothetical protein DI529_11675 [Chryseobacterium sp.]|nr:MAG: hypothetical protein DI529_11675 [Chryseobacterium sp.]
MKKILLSCFLAFGIVANAQFSENFDASTSAPAGWSVINGGGTSTFIFSAGSPGSALSAPNAAQINYDSVAHDDYLVTPSITVTAGVNDRLTFFVKNQDPNYVENYDVKVSTTTATAAAFTTFLKTNGPAPNAWTQVVLDLTPYLGQTIYIGFHATSTDKFRLLFDNVVNDTAPTTAPDCASLSTPANNATGVDSTNTTLTWTAPTTGGPVSYYELYMDTTTNPTTKIGTFVNPTATFSTTNNNALLSGTKYYWRIVAVNSAGSSTGCSSIYNFTTATIVSNGCTNAPNGAYGTLVPSTCNGTTAATRTTAYAGEYSTVTVVAGNTYKFETLLKPNYYITIATNATTPVVLTHGTNPVTYTPTTSGTIRFYSHTDGTCTGLTNSTTSHTRSVICMGTLAVSDINKSDISVYPNPFKDVLKISDVKGVKSISVNDMSGRQVKSLAPSTEINLSNLKEGLYIVNLQMEDGSVKSFKAIKK